MVLPVIMDYTHSLQQQSRYRRYKRAILKMIGETIAKKAITTGADVGLFKQRETHILIRLLL